MKARWISAIEFLIGAAIVIGHNVYKVIPNEVPILFVIGWISIRLRNGGWRAVGLRRPSSWLRTIAIALGVAALRIAIGQLLPEGKAPAHTEEIHASVKDALMWLGIVWTFAAFGEELSYRGYLLNRGAEIGNRSQVADWIAMVAVAILFGFGHYYKGPAGMIDSGIAGLLLGSAYLLTRRNLWVPILAHGFIDTVGVVALFFGWND